MATLDVREKARRIVELFRSRQPIEILPADLSPANLDEAYAIRHAFQCGPIDHFHSSDPRRVQIGGASGDP
jgi:hypothetical protein